MQNKGIPAQSPYYPPEKVWRRWKEKYEASPLLPDTPRLQACSNYGHIGNKQKKGTTMQNVGTKIMKDGT